MNINKFSIHEMFNNSKGKTSLTLLCAFTTVFSGSGTFIYGASILNSDVMIQSLAMVGIGSSLLGIRRFTADKEIALESDKIK